MSLDTAYLLTLVKQTIEIDSITPHEETLAAFFADEIRKLGIDPQWHEVAPGRPNVYSKARLGPADDMLLLTGHLDTVDIAENWETPPLKAVEKDGKLFGLGSYDMKSGLVCAFMSFKTLLEDKSLHSKLGTIAFAATVDEEGYGLGAKALLETEYKDSTGIIVTEPFWGSAERPLPIGLTGKVLYKLSFQGKMSHGFYPERGVNAVEEAGKLLAALESLNLYNHALYGKGNYSTLKIEGGYKEYAVVVPERCDVIISRLTVPGESKETALEDMQTLLKTLDLKAEVRVEILEPFYDPYLLENESRLKTSFDRAYKQSTGQDPHYAFLKGITDANIYVTEGGIPSLTFGPKGNGAHECNEYVELDSLVPVAQVLIDACIHYFDQSAAD